MLENPKNAVRHSLVFSVSHLFGIWCLAFGI